MTKKDTYIPRNEVVDINKDFDKVRKKAEVELLKFPGVVAVGVGFKQTKGEVLRQPCFKVTVKSKRDKSKVKPADMIPESLYGFKTDVDEVLVSTAGVDKTKYRPLMAGSQLTPSEASGAGTLGCFATRNSDGKKVVLSNWHVMVGRPDRLDGDRVGQPTHNGCCTCCASSEIGKVTDGRFLTDDMDAAIAVLNGQDSDTTPDDRFLNEVLGIGTIAGSTAPLAMETVRKYGRTTGLTTGQIFNDNTSHDTIYKEYNNLSVFRNGIVVIQPSPPFADYFLEGDSGSVSLNENNQVVSLNFSFTTAHFTFSTNIVRIATTLGITIPDSTFHPVDAAGKGIGVPLSSLDNYSNVSSLAKAMAELETEIARYGEGKRILELFKIHRSELLDLVNHKREVMAAWNRYQGPSYLAHIARSVRRENKPVPEQIKGITLQSLLLKMTAVLQRNGSPELAQSVTENYLQIMNVLSSGQSPEHWKAYLAHLDEMALA